MQGIVIPSFSRKLSLRKFCHVWIRYFILTRGRIRLRTAYEWVSNPVPDASGL